MSRKMSDAELQRRGRVAGYYVNVADALRSDDIARQEKSLQAADKLLEGVTCQTLIHHAAIMGNEKLIRMLASRGYNVNAANADKETPLHVAEQGNDVGTVAALIELGADINAQDSDGNTPLHRYCATKDNAITLELIKAKPDLEIKNKLGETPFLIAVTYPFKGKIEVIKAMVYASADISVRKNNGKSALVIAFESDFPDAVSLLLKLGLNLTPIDGIQKNVLHFATEKGAADVAEMLIAKGHGVNAEDYRGRTPLHVAFSVTPNKFSSRIIRTLVFAGADVDATDTHGHRPLSYLDPSLSFFVPEYEDMIRTRTAESVDENISGSESPRRSPRRI